MKIVFMGTPDFAVPCLEALCSNGYTPIGVVTQPDRPKGRGNKVMPPAVKVAAEKLGIPVYQFEKIKSEEGVQTLKDLRPDLMITAAFGQILSAEILDIAPLGCVNVHASLLPKYRGAAPIQWAILNGDKVTGVTTMYTELGLDSGDMILKKEIEILPEETGGQLFDRLSVLGAETLIETVKLIENNAAPRTPQQHELAVKCGMIKKEMGNVDWNLSAQSIYNLVRAFDPWPGAYTYLNGQVMKIWKTAISDRKAESYSCGEVIVADSRDGLIVKTGDKALEILELQMPNGKRMSAVEYLRAHSIEAKTILTGEI